MHKQVIKEVLKELVGLKKGVHLVETHLKIPLKPQYFLSVKEGIQKVLDESIFTYNSKISGFLLGYKKLKVTDNHGVVLPDSGESVISVSVKFYVFNPVEGDELSGIVTKVTKKHLACLIYGIINGSLKIPKAERSCGNKVNVGSNVNFTVKQVHLHDRVPLIEGEYLGLCSDAPISLVPESLPKSPKQVKPNKRVFEEEDEPWAKRKKMKTDPVDNATNQSDPWFSTPFPAVGKRRSMSDSTEEMFGNLSPVNRRRNTEETNDVQSSKVTVELEHAIVNEDKKKKKNDENADIVKAEVAKVKDNSKKPKKQKKNKKSDAVDPEPCHMNDQKNEVLKTDAEAPMNKCTLEDTISTSNHEPVSANKSHKRNNIDHKYKEKESGKSKKHLDLGSSLNTSGASNQDSLIEKLVSAKQNELFQPRKKTKRVSKKKAPVEPVPDSSPVNVKKTTNDIISELLQKQKQMLFGGPGAKVAKAKKKVK